MNKIKEMLSKFFENELGQITCCVTVIIVLVYFQNRIKMELLFGKSDLSEMILVSIFIIFSIFLIANFIIYSLRMLIMLISDKIKMQILKKHKYDGTARIVVKVIVIENFLHKILYWFQVIEIGRNEKSKPIKQVEKDFRISRNAVMFLFQTMFITFFLYKNEILDSIHKIDYNLDYINKGLVFLKENWNIVITVLLIMILVIRMIESNRYKDILLNSQSRELQKVIEVNKELQIYFRKIAIYMNEMLKETFCYCKYSGFCIEEIAREFDGIEYNYTEKCFEPSEQFILSLNELSISFDEKREEQYCLCVNKIKQILDDFYKKESFYGISGIRIIDNRIKMGGLYFLSSGEQIKKRLDDVISRKNIQKIVKQQIQNCKNLCLKNDVENKCEMANRCLESIGKLICNQWIEDVNLLIIVSRYINDIYRIFKLKKRDYSSGESLIKLLK